MTFSARLGIEGGRDISQAGPDMFVTLSKHFSNIFWGGGGEDFLEGGGAPFTPPPWLRAWTFSVQCNNARLCKYYSMFNFKI